MAAGVGCWCRIITHWKLHQATALWAASQLLHVTLVRCPAVVACCSKTWCPCSHSQWAAVAGPASSWGQGEIIPVPGSRCWTLTLGRHSHLLLSLSLSGHGMETETPWPPTNVTTKYRCCHGASWRVTRDACPHLLRHSFSDDFISPDTTWGRHIRPWRTEEASRIWKLNCINISAPPQENSRQARCVKDRSPNLEFSWQGFYLVYTEYRRLSLTLVDRNTSLSSVKYLLYADTCIVMKSKYLDDIFT